MLRRNFRNEPTLGLPTTRGNRNQRSFFQRNDRNDGSAASIRLTNPMVKLWRKSDTATKVTYVCLLSFILSMFLGYKILRYKAASVWVTCTISDCYVQVTPWGRAKTTSLSIARSQLARVETVATTYDGVYINSNPNIKTETRYDHRGGKYNKKSGASKGPDLDGNYVSYALYLKDETSFAYQRSQGGNGAETKPADNNSEHPIVDLQPLKKFMEVTEDGSYRLSVRKFGMQQSRRRVRTMFAKIDSYIHRRRQKLVMKESKSPSVLAIIMMVGGLVGLLLTLLIGAFWEDDELYERERQHRSKLKPRTNYAARQTPSRYEVRTSASRRQNSKFS